jgi:hypothetical protein
MADFPIPRVEPKLLVLHKLAGELDEIGGLERAAGAELGVIAPDPQSHPVAGIGQTQFAVGLLLARDLRGDGFHLHMHARFHRRAVLRVTSNFRESQQVHLL